MKMALTKLETPRKLQRGTFLGECYQGDEYVGSLHSTEGGYRVLEVNDGKVYAESSVMHASCFRRAGGLQLSAGQYVKHYQLQG
jgi:hypothetical protein